MDKGKYKAIISDFDGTLAGEDSIISPKVQTAIKQWINKGKIFSIATGRQFVSIKSACDLLNLDFPHIVRGGAEIFDISSCKVVWSQYLKENEVHEIVQLLLKYKIPFHVEKENFVFTEKAEMTEGYELLTIKKLSELTYNNIPRIMLWTDVGVNENIVDDFIETELNSRFKGLHIIKAHTPYWKSWDITSKKASKHMATLEWLKIMQIKPEEIIAIGDGYNDYPLLSACGYKIAMGNAHSELKEIADLVVPSYTDDGVAFAIEKLLKL